MQSLRGSIRLVLTRNFTGLNDARLGSLTAYTATSNWSSEFGADSSVTNNSIDSSRNYLRQSFPNLASSSQLIEKVALSNMYNRISMRGFATGEDSNLSTVQFSSKTISDVAQRIKFKRLDKTSKHIMQILDKEAVEEVRSQRGIPEIKPGYIVQLKVEVPENKRRVSIVKGIVIARRNAGLNTTFRLRRLVAGVGVESLFPLYSPNLKEIKVLDKKKVRRAKLYYLRDKMNALKN